MTAVAVGVALVPPLLVAVAIARYGVNVPQLDQWGFAPEVLLYLSGSYEPSRLWTPFGQHRIAAPKAVMLVLASATRWDVRAEMWFNFAAELASLALLADLARRSLAPLAPAAWIWSVPWISAALFSLAAWHSWTWGWMMNAYLAVLGTALAAWACGVYAQSGRGLAGMIAGAALAATSYLSGVLLLVLVPPAVALVAEGRVRWRHAAVAAIAGLALLALYAAGYPAGSVAGAVGVSELDLPRMLLFTARNAGIPLAVRDERLALVWGAAAIAVVALGSASVFAGPRWRRALVPWLLVASFAVANGVATATGRLAAGPRAAVLPRYALLPSLLWASLPAFAIAGASAAGLPRRARGVRLLAALALAMAVFLVGRSYVAQNAAGVAASASRSASLRGAQRCVVHIETASERCLRRIQRTRPAAVRRLARHLRRHRIGPFADTSPAPGAAAGSPEGMSRGGGAHAAGICALGNYDRGMEKGRLLNLSHVRPEFYRWRSEVESDGREYFVVVPGLFLDRAMHARYRAIRAYLDAGLDVIADDVVWEREWLADATRLFDGYRVWFVGVHVSDEEGARREVQRGDRHGGWNRGSARAAHTNAMSTYDFEIDTTERPPHVLARELEGRLADCPAPAAFARLRTELRDVGLEVG